MKGNAYFRYCHVFIMQERIMPRSLSLLSAHSRQQLPTGKCPDRRLPDRLLQRELRQDLRLQPCRGTNTSFNATHIDFSQVLIHKFRANIIAFVRLYLDDAHT